MPLQDLQTIPLDLLVSKAPNASISCTCNNCGRLAGLTAGQLLDHLTIKRIDRRTPVWDLARHLSCGSCRSRDVSTKVTLAPFQAIDGFGRGDQPSRTASPSGVR